MIPIVVRAGYRVVVPDLIGFGKSDKIQGTDAYSYQSHVDWLTDFVLNLNLQRITLSVRTGAACSVCGWRQRMKVGSGEFFPAPTYRYDR